MQEAIPEGAPRRDRVLGQPPGFSPDAKIVVFRLPVITGGGQTR